MYELEWCPHSHRVRQVLTELGLTYLSVAVPAQPEERAEVIALSGQPVIPVLQDGDKVLCGSDEIIQYLRSTYPASADAQRHAAAGRWRASGTLSLAPRAALARLEELLATEGFLITARVRGETIDDRIPGEYVLLGVTAPDAAFKAFKADPLAPIALLLPIAVMPAAGGGSVVATADPVGQVWLYGEPALLAVQRSVKQRLVAVLGAL